jgi:hypothetical protein
MIPWTAGVMMNRAALINNVYVTTVPPVGVMVSVSPPDEPVVRNPVVDEKTTDVVVDPVQ